MGYRGKTSSLSISGNDNEIIRMNGTNGIQSSNITIDDNENLEITQDSSITWSRADRSSGGGTTWYFEGQNAASASGLNGGDIRFDPGQGDGAGSDGSFYVQNATNIGFTTSNHGNIQFAGKTLRTVEKTITASTTQTQGQQPLTKDINEISTVANANDVVTLPSAVTGSEIYVRNNGANTLQIFPASSDAIDNQAINTSVTLAAGASTVFRAVDNINWYQ
jgi:hypothetical protein